MSAAVAGAVVLGIGVATFVLRYIADRLRRDGYMLALQHVEAETLYIKERTGAEPSPRMVVAKLRKECP